jgi:hypothetical protein
MEAQLPPMRGEHLVRWHEITEEMDGDEEESMTTRGLDFVKPYQSASHSWRMDAKA